MPLEHPVESDGTPAHASSRRRWWLFRIGILLLIAVGQEGVFRLLFPLPEVERFNRIEYQQMATEHPNFSAVINQGLAYDRLLVESRPDGFSEVHGLNLYGFRGPDFRVDPDPGRRRILLIGDSVVEGEGVGDSGTISADWSRLLAKDGISAEVINLGVIAASLPHLWILTRDAVRLLEPDDVVLMLYANDLPAPEFAHGEFDWSGPKFPRTPAELWRKPRAAALVDRVILDQPILRRWPHLPIRFFAPVPDLTNPWTGVEKRPADLSTWLYEDMITGRLNPWLYRQSKDMPGLLSHDFETGGSPKEFLERVDEVRRRSGARLIIGYTPFCGVVHKRYANTQIELGMDQKAAEGLSTDPRYRSQNRILAEVCDELNLPLADATEALEAAEATGHPQFWRYDTHPNAEGYATIAAALHDVWRSLEDGGEATPAK